MPRTRIRLDRHGPYVRGDGRLFRPEHPVGYHHLPDGTAFAVGEDVLFSPTATTCRVRLGGATETWHSHGCDFRRKAGPASGIERIPSEQLHRPGHPGNWVRPPTAPLPAAPAEEGPREVAAADPLADLGLRPR